MHEQAAAALGLRCHYQLIEVAGAGPEQLRALLDGVRMLGFAGVNVTFPYKETVVGLLVHRRRRGMRDRRTDQTGEKLPGLGRLGQGHDR